VNLRDLPSVDELARSSDDPLSVQAARIVLARAREEIQAGAEPGDPPIAEEGRVHDRHRSHYTNQDRTLRF